MLSWKKILRYFRMSNASFGDLRGILRRSTADKNTNMLLALGHYTYELFYVDFRVADPEHMNNSSHNFSFTFASEYLLLYS